MTKCSAAVYSNVILNTFKKMFLFVRKMALEELRGSCVDTKLVPGGRMTVENMQNKDHS